MAEVTRREFLRGCALAVAALGAGTFGLSGCSAGGSGGQVTVTDYVGRQVEVPSSPERIAGLDSFTGELMVLCGAGPQLVGTPTGVVSDVLLQQIYPDLVNVPAPMSNGAINIEELMSEDPDVVIVKEEVYSTSGQPEKLDATGIPYVVVGYTSIDEQVSAMRLVGQVCGGDTEGRVEKLATYYEDTVADCKKRAQDLKDADKVKVYHSINALSMTDGANSLGADWVSAVGAVDVSATDESAASATDYTASLEQVYSWDPDVIICNSADTTDYLKTKANCAGLRAVKSGEVHTIPVGATRWGQRGSVETYLAMIWLGKTVYPKLYRDVNLKKTVVSYYRDYIGLEIDDATYKKILSGEGIRQQSQKGGK